MHSLDVAAFLKAVTEALCRAEAAVIAFFDL